MSSDSVTRPAGSVQGVGRVRPEGEDEVVESAGGRVLVHIGLPKTGTTSLQGWLWSNRAALRDLGCLYPGSRQTDHWLATLDLHGRGFAGHAIAGAEGAWTSMVEQVQAWPGQSIISHELLALTKPDEIERLCSDFSGREVHVVLTLRDLSKVVPATWQERAKNGSIERWADFVREVSKGPDAGHDFWDLQDAPQILERWSKYVPGHRIHVITVPRPHAEADLLLSRFAEVLGVDASRLGALPERPNESIGAVEVALVQQVNKLLLDASIDFDSYHGLIKHMLVPDFLAARTAHARFALSPGARPWIEKQIQRTMQTVKSLGCQVAGDLDELQPAALSDGADLVDPDAVTPDAVLDASAEVIVELTRSLQTILRRNAVLQHERDRAVAEAQVTTMEGMKRRVVRAGEANGFSRVLLRLWRTVRRQIAGATQG